MNNKVFISTPSSANLCYEFFAKEERKMSIASMTYSALFMECHRTKELLMAEASNNRKLREGRTKLRKSLETIAAAHKQITAELQHAQCQISTLQGANADYAEGEKRLYAAVRENKRVIANYRERDKLHVQEKGALQQKIEYRGRNMDVTSWEYDRNVIAIKAQMKKDVELRDYGILGRVALEELTEKSVVLEARQAGLTAAKVTIARYRTMVANLRTANSNLRESLRIKRSASLHLNNMVDNLTMKLRDSENAHHHWYKIAQRT